MHVTFYDVKTDTWRTQDFPPFNPAQPPDGLPQDFKDYLQTDAGRQWYSDPPESAVGCYPDLGGQTTLGPLPANGDADSDGQTDAVDAALVLQFDARITGPLPCMPCADVNADVMWNSVDALLILQAVAGLTQLPLG